MSSTLKNISYGNGRIMSRYFSSAMLGLLSLSIMQVAPLSSLAQVNTQASPGLVWQVQGEWRLNGRGAPLLSGDSIIPRSLLQPGNDSSAHLIVILLPDSQRIFYQCFAAADCARSFRVPPLYRTPDPFAAEMVARVQAVLAIERPDSSPVSKAERDSRLPRDEAAAVLDADNRVQIGGLASALPDGRYTCDILPLDDTHRPQLHVPVDKRDHAIAVSLPFSGLYILKIFDAGDTPRINLFVAALKPEQAVAITASFSKASALIEDWNEDSAGWPTHAFRRAYLESLVKDIKPQNQMVQSIETSGVSARGNSGGPGDTAPVQTDTAAEPSFSPKPGVFSKGIEVTLQSDNSEATIHYTTNDSQPLESSPVYHAPIVLKGSTLVIKAYASSQGKKDSPVVTGIFRIED
jgi:hypothetical protein